MVFGGEAAAPDRMIGVHVHLLGLGLVALFYSRYLDDLFESYTGATAAAAVTGQLEMPPALPGVYAGGLGFLGPFVTLTAAVNVVVAFAFAVNFLRRGF